MPAPPPRPRAAPAAALLVLALALLGAGRVQAQQQAGQAAGAGAAIDPAQAAPPGPTPVGRSFWRLGFYEWVTWRFHSAHPYYRMTGNEAFRDGRSSLNSTQDNTGILLEGDANHEGGQSAFVKIAHGLPPLSLEYVMPLDNFLIPAWSVGAYYTNTWLTDQTAAVDVKRQSQVPLIEMRNHFYIGHVTLNLLTPPAPNGVELYYGLGGAHVETTLRNGFRGHGTRQVGDAQRHVDLDSYHSDGFIPVQRLGFLNNFDNFGIALELYFIGEGKAFTNPFWNSERIITEPVARDIELQGFLFRAAFGIYNFWD